MYPTPLACLCAPPVSEQSAKENPSRSRALTTFFPFSSFILHPSSFLLLPCAFFSPGLTDGKRNGIFYAMKATIDNAGRLVISKEIRREAGLKPGLPLDVRWENGKIAITPAPLSVKLERKGRLLVAVSRKGIVPLKTETVEQVRKMVRQERSSRS